MKVTPITDPSQINLIHHILTYGYIIGNCAKEGVG
jgi:hypothetical protein